VASDWLKSRVSRSFGDSRLAHLAVALGWLGLVVSGCGGDERPEGEPKSLEEWKALRAYHDENVWAEETLAQEYELTLVAIWDALLGVAEDYDRKVDILSSIQFDEVTFGKPKFVERFDHGIESFVFEPPGTTLTHEEWETFLRELASGGYRLIQSEFHHARFVPATDNSPARSLVKIVFHIIEDGAERRIIVDGLNGLPGVSCVEPGGAFYAFPNIVRTNKDARTLQDLFLNEAGVATIAGTAFGAHGEGYLRFSYANSAENIREALGRIRKVLA